MIAPGTRAMMRDATPVIDLQPGRGLLRGSVVVGHGAEGRPVVRSFHWYPDGRMTPARETQQDLDLGGVES